MLLKRDDFFRRLVNVGRPAGAKTRRRNRRQAAQRGLLQEFRSAAEALEERWLLSANPVALPLQPVQPVQPTLNRVAHTTFVLFHAQQPSVKSDQLVSNFDSPITPSEMEAAYGITSLNFGTLTNLGKGQTIALVDAYNDPDIVSDANTFSTQYNLPLFNGAGEPTLQVLNQSGGTNVSGIANANESEWDIEESLDVEWAHTMAPGANIILFEANTDSLNDLLTAEVTAGKTAGVSAVSNSWGSSEFQGEQQFDSDFVTPSGHQGVTFLASTGDSGPPTGYPAMSPNVVAVGGSSLYLNPQGAYLGESVWGNEAGDGAGSGGISEFESQPSYQTGKVNGTSSTFRTTPDVTLDADPITGVLLYDSDSVDWFQVGGTSLASPLMSGIIADANAIRVSNNLGTLNGTTQTLPTLYSVPQNEFFHDISTGISNNVDEFGDNEGNGFAASPGYDIATGLGSPIANNLINYLGGNSTSPPPTVSAPADATMLEGGIYTWDDVISVNDSLPGTMQQVTLTADEGTIQLASTNNVSISAGANDSSSITLTGTLANLNAALGNVTYVAANGYVGSDYIQISVNDGSDSNTGFGAIDMTIVPTSGARIFAGLPVSTPENQSYNFGPGISLTDPDASGASDTLSLTVDNGTLQLASTTGLTFIAGSNNGKTMTVQGTLAALQNAVFNITGGIWYTPNSNFVGQDWLQLSFTNTLDGMPDPSFTSISVLGAPTVSAPRNVQVIENASYVFPNSAFTLSDNAASGTSDSLQLSVADGVIDLGSTTGLTFTQGGSGSSVMTFGGTLANLQAALQSLTYVPDSNYLGTDTLSLTLSDSVDKLSSAKTSVGLSVVAQPTLQAVSNVSTNENNTYTFATGALVLSDASATGVLNTLAIKVQDGHLNLPNDGSGVSVISGGNNTASMTISGSIANLAAELNGLQYIPNNDFSGTDTLSLSYTDSNDGVGATNSVSIDVTNVPPPSITAPTSVTTNENAAYTFASGAISFTDQSAGPSNTDSLTLSVADGKLALGSTTGITITAGANNSSSMIVSGTVANLNGALVGLIYTPNLNYSSGDTLRITATDLTLNVSSSANVSIVFNPLPSVVAPSAIFVDENGSYAFTSGSIVLSDTIASGASDTLSLSVSDGTLNLGSIAGLTFGGGTANNSSSITVTGTMTNLQAAVNGLVYTPTAGFASNDALALSLSDAGDNLTGNASVTITVGNFPPPAVAVPNSASTSENSSLGFGSAISVTDIVASGSSDSMSISVANGTLTLSTTSGLSFSSGTNGTSSMTVTGPLAAMNAALNNLAYAPISGFSGHDLLQVSVTDSTDNQHGSGSVPIAVNPFATAPVAANVLENGAYTFSTTGKTAISLTDGAATATSDTMTLKALSGKLTLPTTTGLTITAGANGTASMTVKGSLANLNAALNGLVYRPNQFFTGTDTLTVTVADASDGLSGSAKVNITVAFKSISPTVSIGSDAAPLDSETDVSDQSTQWDGMMAALEILNG
jgi:subtilase family serine protease